MRSSLSSVRKSALFNSAIANFIEKYNKEADEQARQSELILIGLYLTLSLTQTNSTDSKLNLPRYNAPLRTVLRPSSLSTNLALSVEVHL